MFKKIILSLGVLSAMSAGAMASEVQGACNRGGVIHLLACRPTIMQGGKGVSICRRGTKTFADVSGVVAQGGRTGIVASFVVKEISPQGVGGALRYLDRKSDGKDFELSIPMIAHRPNGMIDGNLELDGRRQPQLACTRTR